MHNVTVTVGMSGQITGEQGNPNLVLEGELLLRNKGLQEAPRWWTAAGAWLRSLLSAQKGGNLERSWEVLKAALD